MPVVTSDCQRKKSKKKMCFLNFFVFLIFFLFIGLRLTLLRIQNMLLVLKSINAISRSWASKFWSKSPRNSFVSVMIMCPSDPGSIPSADCFFSSFCIVLGFTNLSQLILSSIGRKTHSLLKARIVKFLLFFKLGT